MLHIRLVRYLLLPSFSLQWKLLILAEGADFEIKNVGCVHLY